MGRYNATSTKVTKQPMKIMMAAGEHLRKRAGRFADLDHVDGQPWKNLGLSERRRERYPLFYPAAGFGKRILQQPGAERTGRRFQRLHQRNTAYQQRAQHPRELRDLILDPDLADQRQAQAPAVDGELAFFGFGPKAKGDGGDHQGHKPNQNVVARAGTDGNQNARGRRQLRSHAVVEVGKFRNHEGDQKHHQADHERDQQTRIDEREQQLLADR